MDNLNHYKEKLEADKLQLEADLQSIATNTVHLEQQEWNAVVPDKDQAVETRDEVADRLEDVSGRQSQEAELVARLDEIKEALTRLEQGKYGRCKICDQEIEPARLEANPAATTCLAHVDA